MPEVCVAVKDPLISPFEGVGTDTPEPIVKLTGVSVGMQISSSPGHVN